MNRKKTIYKISACFLSMLFFLAIFIVKTRATEYTSANFIVSDPVIGGGGGSFTSSNFGLGQSIGQIAPGKSTSSSFQLWSGFQYYFSVKANTLTATPGAEQVDLNWTAPQTYLGISVADYEVGVGTISGSYVFTSVGTGTSYLKTGLTAGVPYFFRIKALDATGKILTFSNEATATPTSSTPTPTPTGGGGGGGGGGTPTPTSTSSPTPTSGTPTPTPPQGGGNSAITLRGLAYPDSLVTVLRDGMVAANTTADPGAAFNVTLNGLNAGTYSIAVYAQDRNGERSPVEVYIETVTSNISIVVDNIFLAPSIGISSEQVKRGDTLTIFGFAAPQSDVVLFVNSQNEIIQKIQANSSGAWIKQLNTGLLEFGDHTAKSQTNLANRVSNYSRTLAFTVGNKTEKSTNCGRDLNGDCHVDIVDLSIFLYYYNKPASVFPKADFNNDGMIDISDLSILLYLWIG